MKKKYLLILMVFLVSTYLVGCGGDVTITDEQEDIIAQYAAGVMLRYSYENEWKYTKLYDALYGYHKTTSEDTTTSQSTTNDSGQDSTSSTSTTSTSSSSSSTTTTTTVASMSDSLPEALGLSGCTITYSTYTVGSSYPLNPDSVYVPAEEDRVVVGVEFRVTNNTSSTITANTTSSGVLMKLKVGGTTYTNYATLLKNSLLTLNNLSIASGDSITTVVLFQIPKDLSGSVSGATLTATKNSETIGIQTLK